MIPAELPPVDACPSPDCHPGDNPACLPLVTAADGDGTIAGYSCSACGTAWSTAFDPFGWPVDRSIAPPARSSRDEAAA